MKRTDVWMDTGPNHGGRPSLDDPDVRDLLARHFGREGRDLGGTMSLNVGVGDDVVVRVHQAYVSAARIRAERDLRRHVRASGVAAPNPLDIFGPRGVVRCGRRWAEAETFMAVERRPPTADAYEWLFGAMGALHRAMTSYPGSVPRPVVATYATPSTMRRWRRESMDTLVATGARAEAPDVDELISLLARQWVTSPTVPHQIVHGDVRLSNVRADGAGDPVVFDLGFSAVRPRVHDLGYALAWILLTPEGDGRLHDLRPSDLDRYLCAYDAATSVPLSDGERLALPAFTAAVPLYLVSVAGFLPDPLATVRELHPFVEIAREILATPERLTRAR